MSSREIQLSVRLRPVANEAQKPAVAVNKGGEVKVGSETFSFHHNVLTGSDQALAFEALAARLLQRATEGYHCTLMAYGQTGSGKTHTMFGPPGCLTEAAVKAAGGEIPDKWGLFPRSVMQMMRSDGDEVMIHASAIEIYHESVFDLMDNRNPLTVGSKEVGLKVGGAADLLSDFSNSVTAHGVHPAHCTCHRCFAKKEAAKEEKKKARAAKAAAAREATKAGRSDSGSSPQEKFATVGETLVPLQAPEDVARFARTVEATRTAKAHRLNDRSSRSHCLVKVHLTIRRGSKTIRTHMLFVDLAGSERVARTGAEGAAKAEATAINQSLTSLGRVIKQLGDKKGSHVSYRDSTLTMLLRDSFGGNSCTSVVVNAASEPEHVEETLCTLRFGERMAVVRNTPTVVVSDTAAGCKISTEGLVAALEACKTQLSQMEAAGMGGGIIKSAPVTEQKSLLDGMRRLRQAESEVRSLVAARAEAKARGASTSGIDTKIRNANAVVENIAPVVGRQQTIKSLWAEATPAWKKKNAEVKELERQLKLMLA